VVAIEDVNGGSPDWSKSGEEWTGPFEMIHPVITTRMEEPGELSSQRILTCDTGTFVTIAIKAGPGEVCRFRHSAMFYRNDVIRLECETT
jgi:hypothetical protein